MSLFGGDACLSSLRAPVWGGYMCIVLLVLLVLSSQGTLDAASLSRDVLTILKYALNKYRRRGRAVTLVVYVGCDRDYITYTNERNARKHN